MEGFGGRNVRFNLERQARLFQGAVAADILDPLVGQDDVFPFGSPTPGPWPTTGRPYGITESLRY